MPGATRRPPSSRPARRPAEARPWPPLSVPAASAALAPPPRTRGRRRRLAAGMGAMAPPHHRRRWRPSRRAAVLAAAVALGAAALLSGCGGAPVGGVAAPLSVRQGTFWHSPFFFSSPLSRWFAGASARAGVARRYRRRRGGACTPGGGAAAHPDAVASAVARAPPVPGRAVGGWGRDRQAG